MKGQKNDYRQRRNIRRGRLAFQNIRLAFLSMAAFMQNEANEKRAARVRAEEHRPLVVHYDHEKDETITLSEYRREHHPVNRTAVGYPVGYGQRKGATLKAHSGIVKPVGKLGFLRGFFTSTGDRL